MQTTTVKYLRNAKSSSFLDSICDFQFSFGFFFLFFFFFNTSHQNFCTWRNSSVESARNFTWLIQGFLFHLQLTWGTPAGKREECSFKGKNLEVRGTFFLFILFFYHCSKIKKTPQENGSTVTDNVESLDFLVRGAQAVLSESFLCCRVKIKWALSSDLTNLSTSYKWIHQVCRFTRELPFCAPPLSICLFVTLLSCQLLYPQAANLSNLCTAVYNSCITESLAANCCVTLGGFFPISAPEKGTFLYLLQFLSNSF